MSHSLPSLIYTFNSKCMHHMNVILVLRSVFRSKIANKVKISKLGKDYFDEKIYSLDTEVIHSYYNQCENVFTKLNNDNSPLKKILKS